LKANQSTIASNHKKTLLSVGILVLLLISLVGGLFVYQNTNFKKPVILLETHINQEVTLTDNINFKIQQVPTIDLPDNFTNELVGDITNAIWDVINVLFSFIPFFGSNGSMFTDVIFYGSIFGGVVIGIKMLQKRMY